MNKVGTSLFLGVILVAGYFSLSQAGVFANRCERPLAYRVGSIDSRFDISTSTARELLVEAEAVWEEAAGKELFTYDESADFTVDFIYDERQETTNEINEYESALSDLDLSHDEIIAAYQEAKEKYDAELADYEQQKGEYEADLEEYNEQVSYWNNNDGAPRDVHEDLMDERSRLFDELEELQSWQQNIEILRREVNTLASRGNVVAREYNETASTFSSRFGESQEFNQATYTGDGITVYQFEQADDLRLALAHEFGHSLGIKHVEDPESLMHYLMKDQSLSNLFLTKEDLAALDNICSYDI